MPPVNTWSPPSAATGNNWGVDADRFGSNAPFRGAKKEGYEGGLRILCVMWGPGYIPAGRVCSEIATIMDFLPTFTAMAGAKLPDDRIMDGKDIRRLMLSEVNAVSPYNAFIYHD